MSEKLKPCEACGHMIAANEDLSCPNCGKVYKKEKAGCLTIIAWIIAIFMILSALGSLFSAFSDSSDTVVGIPNKVSSNSDSSTTEMTSVVEDTRTMGQRNASNRAEEYLSGQAFSAKGLYEQLMFEGYSKEDAEYAINSISVDWNEQAALKAKQYLDGQSFSRQGLIEQLEFEGFTRSQAKYGVDHAGY